METPEKSKIDNPNYKPTLEFFAYKTLSIYNKPLQELVKEPNKEEAKYKLLIECVSLTLIYTFYGEEIYEPIVDYYFKTLAYAFSPTGIHTHKIMTERDKLNLVNSMKRWYNKQENEKVPPSFDNYEIILPITLGYKQNVIFNKNNTEWFDFHNHITADEYEEHKTKIKKLLNRLMIARDNYLSNWLEKVPRILPRVKQSVHLSNVDNLLDNYITYDHSLFVEYYGRYKSTYPYATDDVEGHRQPSVWFCTVQDKQDNQDKQDKEDKEDSLQWFATQAVGPNCRVITLSDEIKEIKKGYIGKKTTTAINLNMIVPGFPDGWIPYAEECLDYPDTYVTAGNVEGLTVFCIYKEENIEEPNSEEHDLYCYEEAIQL